ncbi:hypothetical protein [Heyndrickxia coagulans]|uniref:hypothetical protein n=1 Tax=Heyndrickxia coagulans TaxID=1398 RepID=UPI0011D260CC|nr:hypothetical protein [Heyndrickxia coagulans]
MPVVLAVRTVSIYDADMNGWAVAFLSMPGVHVSMHVKRVFLSRQHPLFEGRHSGAKMAEIIWAGSAIYSSIRGTL